MNHEARRAAINAYKNQVIPAGIFAIRCLPSEQCWVGKSVDLRAARNRLRFTLSQGVSPYGSLQDAWRQHGEASFTFEAVEELDPELSVYERDRTLDERLDHWLLALGAEGLQVGAER